jgi:nitrate reductase assembly molybdenum cofactor insertion protein NarJ
MELKYSIGYAIDRYPDDVKLDVLQNYKEAVMEMVNAEHKDYLNCFFEYIVNEILSAHAEYRDEQVRKYIKSHPAVMKTMVDKLNQYWQC